MWGDGQQPSVLLQMRMQQVLFWVEHVVFVTDILGGVIFPVCGFFIFHCRWIWVSHRWTVPCIQCWQPWRHVRGYASIHVRGKSHGVFFSFKLNFYATRDTVGNMQDLSLNVATNKFISVERIQMILYLSLIARSLKEYSNCSFEICSFFFLK